MPTPILPDIIQGPAIVIHDGYSFYTKGPIISRIVTDAFAIDSDMHGKIDDRLKSRLTEISFQPVGEIESLAKFFPWDHSSVGASIFGATNKDVVIHTKAGATITYPRGGISRMPPLRLRPIDTLFGDMTITCIGDKDTDASDNAYWRTIGASAFADIGFDETKIVTDWYQAAYGAAPYDAMGALNGFELDLQIETTPINADDVGIADIVIRSIMASGRFIPSNLTEAEVETLLNMQTSSVIYPGQSFSKSNTDLVISGSGSNGITLTVTIHKAGPKSYEAAYGTGEHRHRAVEFTSKRTWSAGVANALWTLAVA